MVLNQSTITFDFDGPACQTVSLTGNLTLAGTHMGAGKSITIELLADSSDRTLTYDANWVIFGNSVTTVAANKRVIITLKCNNLVTVAIPNLIFPDGKFNDMDRCALSAASVNLVLARAVASGVTSCNFKMDLGTSSAPTDQGIVDKAALITAGNTVMTN